VKRLAPGLYDDGDGGLHLAVDELLKAHGYADTPKNRDRLTRAAQELIAEYYGVEVTVTTEPIAKDPVED
jgi:hypothetical protein